MENNQPKVSVTEAGGGYFIEVKDEFTENRLAVTESELREIIEKGHVALHDL